MKRLNGVKLHSDSDLAGSIAMRDRRKAYYHGKYNKEVLSIFILIAGVAMLVVRQGA